MAQRKQNDPPKAIVQIEHQTIDLATYLFQGGGQQKSPVSEIGQAKKDVAKNVTVRVGRETKGRSGKGVTTVSDLPLDETGLAELATKLKQRLGTGGTAKDGRIEIQGDQRDRIVTELERMGYRVKRVGG